MKQLLTLIVALYAILIPISLHAQCIGDAENIPWLEGYINDPCYAKFYTFKYNGQDLLYLEATENCVAANIGDLLFTCNGELICNIGGITTLQEQCAFQNINVNPYVVNNNLFWEAPIASCLCPAFYDPVCGTDNITYGNACHASCAGVGVAYDGFCQDLACGLENPSQMPWLQTYINDVCYDVIYAFNYNGQDMVYAQATSSCENTEGSLLFTCNGSLVCTVDGNTSLQNQCSFQNINFDNLLFQSNIIWSLTDNVCQLRADVFLQGPFNSNSQLMNNGLRVNNLIPNNEPYTDLPDFEHVNGGNETVSNTVLTTTGFNAIVDWMFIELIDPFSFETVSSRSALLQRDGDLVDVDGISPVSFRVDDGNYFVCVRHRNHLGAMTNEVVYFSSNNIAQVNYNTANTWGDEAMAQLGNNKKALWCGHTDNNQKVSFQGPTNNPNDVFFSILTTLGNANNSANYIQDNVYIAEDVNLDGRVIYQGNGSDVNTIFFSILQHPENTTPQTNYIIYQQLP